MRLKTQVHQLTADSQKSEKLIFSILQPTASSQQQSSNGLKADTYLV